MDDEHESRGPTDGDPAEPRVFDSITSNARRAHPKDKMLDISRNSSFVCLPHLDSDRGLNVEVGGSPHAEEGDDKVWDIWGLEVRSLHPSRLSPSG